MPAYDYSAVADIYDDFCVFDGDLEFFRDRAASVRGPVLELMAGTGRVSLPMIEAGAAVTSVDLSPPMLRVLEAKLHDRGLHARMVCADVGRMPFDTVFEMVVLPFQGFCELIGEDHQRRCLVEVSRVLLPGGGFVCTSHNPRIRARTIDGQWHEFGRITNQAGRTLSLHLQTDYAADRPNVVEGVQRIEILDRDGALIESRDVELEFSLVEPSSIIEMADSVGLRPVNLYGDYSAEAFDENTSPSFIAVLEKRD
jgi:SAM-dependent methyltransferase